MKHVVLVSLFLIAAIPLFAAAEVNVTANIPLPPPLEFPGPPDVVVVPSGSADVYLVPGMPGLYFYGGNWYRFHKGYWYLAALYSGPWVAVGLVPSPVAIIPPDYVLDVPGGYHRIHYDEFQNHWREWQHSRYWHSQPWYRDHAAHHWGGREFLMPSAGHHPDMRGRPGVGAKPGAYHGPKQEMEYIDKAKAYGGSGPHKGAVHSGPDAGGHEGGSPQSR